MSREEALARKERYLSEGLEKLKKASQDGPQYFLNTILTMLQMKKLEI